MISSHPCNPIRSVSCSSPSARQFPADRPTHSATCPKQGRPRTPLRPQLPPLHRRQTLLESTLTHPSATVDSKPLIPDTKSFISNTYKKTGGAGLIGGGGTALDSQKVQRSFTGTVFSGTVL